MTTISSVVLDVPDVAAASTFYAAAFDLGDRLQLREAQPPTDGFRGYTVSLLAAQPADVDELHGAAVAAGATVLKPAGGSLWGYGGVVQAPDGAIWKLATSARKSTRPASRAVEKVVLLLAASDVAASKRFYVDRGVEVARSFGRKYVEFVTAPEGVGLGLYGRRALAKDAGVPADGAGSARLAVRADVGSFTDPDGYVWEA